MKRTLLLSPGLLLIMGIFTAGCAPPEVQAAFQAEETPIPVIEDTQDTVEVAAVLPPTPTPIPDMNCIQCHSDEALLQELGEEEEKPEVPSEGSG